jgi:type IV secretory pathway VirB4 component
MNNRVTAQGYTAWDNVFSGNRYNLRLWLRGFKIRMRDAVRAQIVAILTREGLAITPEVKEHVWTALTSLASAPIEERTLTGLSVLLQSNDLKQALRPHCVGGANGRLLDAEAEHLGEASVQAFETEGLIGTGAAPAVLSYLFHRIGDRLDGRPTLLIIDEGWLALSDPGFSKQLAEWLVTLRKKNASVVFATQSLAQLETDWKQASAFHQEGARRSAGFRRLKNETLQRMREQEALVTAGEPEALLQIARLRNFAQAMGFDNDQ